MSRLTLTDADKKVRDYFVETTKSLGCTIKIDAMGKHFTLYHGCQILTSFSGNIFATRPGKKDGPPTYAGSHLDTQVGETLYFSLSCLLMIIAHRWEI